MQYSYSKLQLPYSCLLSIHSARKATSQGPVGLFELDFCSTGALFSFSYSLAGFAALCNLRYGSPHPRAPAPAPVTRRLCTWLSCLREE